MEKRTRVYWDEEEKETLVQRVFELIQTNPIAAINDLIEQAQDRLPEGRRRPSLIIQAISWLEEDLAAKFRLHNSSHGSKDKKAEDLQKRLDEAEEQLKLVPTKDELREEALDDMDSTELLVRYIRKQGEEGNAVLYRLERMEGFIFNTLPSILSASGKTTLVKPESAKLVFVGFKEYEVSVVKMDFSKYADLSFVVASMPVGNYPNKCGQIFISRKGVSENLRGKLTSSRYKDVCNVVDGGVAKLKSAIWSYLKNGGG